MSLQYVFISDGRLFLRDDNGSVREVESKFASEKEAMSNQAKARHAWKAREETANSPFSSSVLWGKQARITPFMKFRFRNAGFMDQNTIYYLMSNNLVTGLFKFTVDQDYEQRLFHKLNLSILGIDYSPVLQQFVISNVEEDGSSSLTTLDAQGSYKQGLTTGDSRDSNPSFSRYNSDKVLFQSAGIERDENGGIYAFGPEAVSGIDLKTGEINEILFDYKYDYLLPKEDSVGNLYCIRRPYQARGHQPLWRTVCYIVSFPIRFIIAIVKFLDAFTRLFNQQPFRTAGPAIEPPSKNKYLNVLGRTIDLARVRRNLRNPDNLSLVPRTWELIRLSKDGNIEVIAKKVSSYDIDNDNKIHITNGFRVNELAADSTKTAFKYDLIEDVKTIKIPSK